MGKTNVHYRAWLAGVSVQTGCNVLSKYISYKWMTVQYSTMESITDAIWAKSSIYTKTTIPPCTVVSSNSESNTFQNILQDSAYTWHEATNWGYYHAGKSATVERGSNGWTRKQRFTAASATSYLVIRGI